MSDYQNIQCRIAQLQVDPNQDEYQEMGCTTLRQCHAEARALLNKAYRPEMLYPPSGPNETEKRQLQRSAPSPVFMDLVNMQVAV